jgi:DNA-binding beta-propeller fold protein YncE
MVRLSILIAFVFGLAPLHPWHDAAAQDMEATPIAAAADETTPAPVAFVREISLGTDPSVALSGVAVAADGTLFVIDSFQDHIRVFDREGNPVATWGESGDGPGQFRFHVSGGGYYGDLAIGPDGNLYVMEPFNNRIQVLNPDGAFLRTWGELGDEPGQLAQPGGIAVDAARRVYVTDLAHDRLQIFSSDGQFLASWELSAAEGGPLQAPADVAVDATGAVYVTDSEQSRVYRFDLGGAITGSFDGSDSPAGPLRNPVGAAVDAQGNLYVADYNGNRVQVFAPDGRSLGSVGSVGKDPGQFTTPIFLTFGPEGLLYVAEEGNRRVQVFRLLPPLGPAVSTPVP